MTDPPLPTDDGYTDDDEIAEVLLADAVLSVRDDPSGMAPTQPGQPAPQAGQPAMGDTHQPAMGVPVTQPPPPTPAPPPAPPSPAPAPTPPAPAPTPPAPAAIPQLVAPVPPAGGPGQPDPAPGTDLGFPANTPWRDMQPPEQVAYWRHQARKHEERVGAMADYEQLKATAADYERLVAASQTEQERAVAEARRQGRAEALGQAGSQLVEQWVRAAAAGRMPQESVTALLQGLDRKRFLTSEGGVDTDKVYTFINTLAPAAAATAAAPGAAPPQQVGPVPAPVVAPSGSPDFGQGQPGTSRPSGLAAGRDIARARFGNPQNQPA